MSYQAGGPSHPPTMSEHGMADQAGSMLFVVAILSALLARERGDGQGQRVECSQLGAMLQFQAINLTPFLHSRHRGVPQRDDVRHAPIATVPAEQGFWSSSVTRRR